VFRVEYIIQKSSSFLFHNQTITERDSFFYTQQALNNKIQADSCQAQGPAEDRGRVSNDFACLCIMGFLKTYFAIGS
jgi:hypothetical protein